MLFDFATGKETKVAVELNAPSVKTRGHGGADFFLMNAFTKAVATGERGGIKTGVADSVRSHKLVFAAERSRLKTTIESVDL